MHNASNCRRMQRTKHNVLVHFSTADAAAAVAFPESYGIYFASILTSAHVIGSRLPIIYVTQIDRRFSGGQCGAIFGRRSWTTKFNGLWCCVRLHSVACVTDRIKLATELQRRPTWPSTRQFRAMRTMNIPKRFLFARNAFVVAFQHSRDEHVSHFFLFYS